MNNPEFEKFRKDRNLSSPTSLIDFQLDRYPNPTELKITLKAHSIVANMQANQATFEGWAICFKARLPDNTKVVLDWIGLKEDALTLGEKRHYNRFKYRVSNFLKLYDWFKIADSKKSIIDDFMSEFCEKNFVINTPEQAETDKPAKEGEAMVEYNCVEILENKVKMMTKFDLSVFNRQLPVGLFEEKKSAHTYYFTGSKSAIDLWGLSKDKQTLHIFELKYKNPMVGIISELLFYMCLMSDVCEGFIAPHCANPDDNRGYGEFHKAARKIKKINGYFLCDKLHRSVDDECVIRLLNSSRRGYLFHRVSYKYDRGVISDIKVCPNK